MHEKRLMTRRLCSYIQQESLKTTFTSIAESVGVDESLVRLIFREHVATLNATYKAVMNSLASGVASAVGLGTAIAGFGQIALKLFGG